ncbi:hypothetical protein GLOIN_2v1791784 [Rhizophagus clarus]|uniref:Uncharacterized protein n=1 Tax=Rhizophagus clarus TaxID=94130 RepID=A0A8H3MC40_9GLOM|nr:hypothetical protein GLOIN_2v1791784 [Rhizophagus clarus]
MMESRGIAYKRAYRTAVKKAQEILYQKIGSSYEIFHGAWLSYEIFMTSNPVEIIWEKFMKCARKLSKDKNLLVDDEMKEKICSDFARYPSELVKCIEEYDLFFQKLVYHMRYKEHMSILEEIGPVSSMRKNEIIANLPALPHISEIGALDEISNLWYFHLEGVTEPEAVNFIDIMAELQEKVSQYIGIKSSEIRLPITEEDRQEFRKIIADQEKMTEIVMEDYRFLQHHGHNGKGGDWIHIG